MKATHDRAANTIAAKTVAANPKIERRQGTDRRQWICSHDFPYVDSHGYLVVHNRRQADDRRQSRNRSQNTPLRQFR